MSTKSPTPFRLFNKVAIVTAASRGIGYAIAERLAQEGANVVICSRREENIKKAMGDLRSKGLEVFGMVCHVGKKEDRETLIKETVHRYGGIDILVSNAGVNPAPAGLLDISEEMWDKIMDINVKSSFLMVKEVAPFMEKRGGGAIALVSSDGAYKPNELIPAYAISKTALVAYNRNVALPLARMNIRCNCLAPGLIKTKMSEALWDNEEILNRSLEHIAIKRVGQPEEMAGVVAFMVSDDASYMTGETIVVSGGSSSRL